MSPTRRFRGLFRRSTGTPAPTATPVRALRALVVHAEGPVERVAVLSTPDGPEPHVILTPAPAEAEALGLPAPLAPGQCLAVPLAPGSSHSVRYALETAVASFDEHGPFRMPPVASVPAFLAALVEPAPGPVADFDTTAWRWRSGMWTWESLAEHPTDLLSAVSSAVWRSGASGHPWARRLRLVTGVDGQVSNGGFSQELGQGVTRQSWDPEPDISYAHDDDQTVEALLEVAAALDDLGLDGKANTCRRVHAVLRERGERTFEALADPFNPAWYADPLGPGLARWMRANPGVLDGLEPTGLPRFIAAGTPPDSDDPEVCFDWWYRTLRQHLDADSDEVFVHAPGAAEMPAGGVDYPVALAHLSRWAPRVTFLSLCIPPSAEILGAVAGFSRLQRLVLDAAPPPAMVAPLRGHRHLASLELWGVDPSVRAPLQEALPRLDVQILGDR